MTERPIPILHLVGSPVDDFHAELSRLYEAGSIDALAATGRYDMTVAYVSPDGCWRFPSGVDAEALEEAPPLRLSEAVQRLTWHRDAVMVPHMFCPPGMTAYRGLFDMLGIRYLGNPPDVMALAADKAKARAVVAAAGVDVPAGGVVRRGDPPPVDVPMVVKPVGADNSVGVTLVRDLADYPAAVEEALRYGDTALVEAYVELGREVRCGIIESDGELVGLPLEAYAVGPDKPIRDRHDKLDRDGGGDMYLVAKDDAYAWTLPVDDPLTARVWEAAARCHRALGCRHYSLFDFRIDPDGVPFFLEAGPYGSFAPSSVVASRAAAAGIDVAELFARMLRRLDDVEATCST